MKIPFARPYRSPAGRKRPAPTRGRSLRLEQLEGRTLLSATVLSKTVAGSAAAVSTVRQSSVQVLAQTYTFQQVAKAQPDQWYTGIGGRYYPYVLGLRKPAGAQGPKVNQDYVWGMTQTADSIWFGSSGNVLCQATAAVGGKGVLKGFANKIHVTEGAQSQYPGVPKSYRPYLGDWRPPQVHRYNFQTGIYQDVPLRDSLLQSTLGFRSAGTAGGVVFLAGPNLYGRGINVFAFNAVTGAFIGSLAMAQYSDIRSWVNVDGQLYAAVARNSAIGDGAVLRWTGNVANPFSFEEVGRMDLEAANMVYHKGRLYVSTWPLNYGSLFAVMGYRSDAHAGVWMSPPLNNGYLTVVDAANWKKVWSVDQYEPDAVVAASYGGGALASFGDYLYWGTMQVPGTGSVVFQDAYGYAPAGVDLKTARTAAVFRCNNLDAVPTPDDPFPTPTVDLLYGDSQLWRYTSTGPSTGTWALAPNKMGAPLYGQAGFDNKYNVYIWSMAVQDGVLYVGTYDSTTTAADVQNAYYSANGNLDAVQAWLQKNWGLAGGRMGADLWAFSGTDGPAVAISKEGLGNPLNHGVRNLQATPVGLFIGTANASNLLTDPASPLHAGGWELLRLGVTTQTTQTTPTAAKQAKAVDRAMASLTVNLGQASLRTRLLGR